MTSTDDVVVELTTIPAVNPSAVQWSPPLPGPHAFQRLVSTSGATNLTVTASAYAPQFINWDGCASSEGTTCYVSTSTPGHQWVSVEAMAAIEHWIGDEIVIVVQDPPQPPAPQLRLYLDAPTRGPNGPVFNFDTSNPQSPHCSSCAIHSASCTSLLRPGTRFRCCGLTSSKCHSGSSTCQTGFHNTPVASIATCVICHERSHAASVSSSRVVVPERACLPDHLAGRPQDPDRGHYRRLMHIQPTAAGNTSIAHLHNPGAVDRRTFTSLLRVLTATGGHQGRSGSNSFAG